MTQENSVSPAGRPEERWTNYDFDCLFDEFETGVSLNTKIEVSGTMEQQLPPVIKIQPH
jgi:hypothetical protein